MLEMGRLVGREHELDQLARLLHDVSEGSGRTLLLGGDGGVGKSMLLREFSLNRAGGARTLWGSTPVPVGERAPYAPFVELLRSISLEVPQAVDSVGPARDELAVIMPGWAARPAATPADPFARQRLFEALRSLVEAAALDSPPLILVLEDLHWADEASLATFAFLVQQLKSAQVMLVATYRSDQLDAEPGLQRLLVELVRLEHVSHHELGGLPPHELAGLVPPESTLSSQVRMSLAERAGGNPYLFSQLLVGAKDDQPRLPRPMRGLLLQRLEALPELAVSIVRVAAVAGRSATGSLLEGMLPDSQEEILAALRMLVRAGLLEAPAEAGQPYSFRQPLLQEAVLDDLLPEERSLLHGQIAQRLAEASEGPGAAPTVLVEQAIHWTAAGAPPSSLPALVAGAQAARQLYAFELAGSFFEHALRIQQGSGAPAADQRELLLAAAEAAYLAGNAERAIDLFERAQQEPGMTAVHLETERLGWYQLAVGDVEGSLESFRRAVELCPADDHSGGARVVASYGRALMLAGRYGEAQAALEEAIRLARLAGSLPDESRALTALGSVLARLGRPVEGAASLEAARHIDERRTDSLSAPRPSRIGYLIGSLLDRAGALEQAGSLEAAAREAQGALDAAQRLGGTGAWSGQIAARAGHELFLLGRWSEAEQVIEQGSRAARPGERVVLATLRARIAAGRGDTLQATSWLELARQLIDSATPASAIAQLELASADTALAKGQPNEARQAVDRAMELLNENDTVSLVEVVVAGLRADAELVGLARLRRSGAAPEEIREDALMLAARAGLAGDTELGPAPVSADSGSGGRLAALRLLAEAELGRAQGTQEADAWQAVAVAFDELPEPHAAALARWREAECLLAQRGDRARASAALDRAAGSAAALGARALTNELAQLARRSRMRLAALPTDTASSEGGPSAAESPVAGRDLRLSQRELEVLGLVATGQTNRQIAEQLFITEKTAGHHVSSILTKLGLSSRIEAAALAHRHGLIEPSVPE